MLLGFVILATYGAILFGARAGGRVTSILRGPASVKSARREAARMNVVNFPCWDKDLSAPPVVGARYVRLTGGVCRTGRQADEITVRNLTNGFEATVFATGANLTTDYIPLSAGGNELVIAYGHGAEARVERRLLLTR